MAKPLPARADLVDYTHAVAGHDGTLCDIDGELFIKPCTSAEIAFYESSIASHPSFAEYMPTYLGTLSLDEQTNGSTTIEEAGAVLLAKHLDQSLPHHHHQHDAKYPHTNGITPAPILPEPPIRTGKRIVTNLAVVLENAAHGFKHPNIMDVKLGTRLWADDAPEEKRIRFNKVTAETTHKDLGFRLAGMRVWQGNPTTTTTTTNSDPTTTKCTTSPETTKTKDPKTEPTVDEENYKVYNKDYGRYALNTSNVHTAFTTFLSQIPTDLSRLVAQAFLIDIEKIEAVLLSQESRMYSASLLLIFEGDEEALRTAMEDASRSPGTLVMESEDGEEVDGEGESEEDEDEVKRGKIYSVNVIDFAHAEWVPGMGPDMNSIGGVQSVRRILEKIVESS